MKRTLFYALALALCSAVGFSSCTKDYDDDLRIQRELIENNEKELRALIDAYQVLVDNTIKQMEIAYKNADDLIKQEMKAEFDAAKKRLTDLETALAAAEGNIAALQSDLAAFKAAVNLDFQRINAHIAAINARIDDADQKIAALDTRLTTIEGAIVDMKAWKTLAEAKLAELERNQEASKAEIEALKTRIAAVEARITALEQQYASLELAMNKADDALNKRIDDLIAQMESQLNMQTTTLTELITNVQIALTDDMAQLRAEMQQFKVDINVAFAEYKQDLDTKFEEISLQIEEIVAQISDMEATIWMITDQIYEIESKLNELIARLAGLASADELKALSTRVDAIYLELRARDKELEVMINANKDDIAAQKAEIAALKQQLADMQTALDQKIADAIADKVTKTEMDAAVAQITADYQAADEALQALIDTLNNTTIPAMETRLDTIEAFIDGLKNRIQALQWIPAFNDGSLLLNVFVDNLQVPTRFRSAIFYAELYLVSNDADIVTKIINPAGDYTVEVLINGVMSRSIQANPFNDPIISAGEAPNTLMIEMSYRDLDELWTSYGNRYKPSEESSLLTWMQVAIKITDSKGNAIMSDFASVAMVSIRKIGA